jgi:hypothetical protein
MDRTSLIHRYLLGNVNKDGATELDRLLQDDVGFELKHAFATDAHPESAGPTLEFSLKD